MVKKHVLDLCKRIALLSLLLILAVSMLASCEQPPAEDEKSMLSTRIETVDVSTLESVEACLSKWKFPKGYDAQKIGEAEKTILDGYYKPLDVRKMAKDAAKCFVTIYYDEIDFSDQTAYTDALIRCLVLALGDDYAVYRTEAEYAAYLESMSGSYGGIGMTVNKNFETGVIKVVRLIENSPAQREGILVGDILYSVEGMKVTKDTMNAAFSKMQGEVGEVVRFEILRGETVIPFAIVRENMENMTVSYKLSEDKIAYITVTSFKRSTYDYFKKAIDDAEAAGAIGFVFDMRDNPGGYLSSVLNVLDYLVPKGTELCSCGTKKDTPQVYVASNAHAIDLPCVVLCNGATASAGELFTAALRDYNEMEILRATVVGTEKATFGKGIMQSAFHLSDGSVLTMTSAFYNPPCGENYHDVGVIPDTVCDAETDVMEVARQELLDLIENK